MTLEEDRFRRYERVLANLEQASRQHAATKTETQDRQSDRTEAIVEISRLGVPRSTVAKLAGLTRGRVQQILDQAGETGATGRDWDDPQLRRLVDAAIAARPIPSAGIGLRRESTLGPHVGRGAGVAVRLTGDLNKDRHDVIAMIERLLDQVRSGNLDYLLSLTEEELDVIQGNLIGSPGNIGHPGGPGDVGRPGDPTNRGAVDYGHSDVASKLLGGGYG